MAEDGHVVRVDAAAVVLDLQQLEAALGDGDGDVRRACVRVRAWPVLFVAAPSDSLCAHSTPRACTARRHGASALAADARGGFRYAERHAMYQMTV